MIDRATISRLPGAELVLLGLEGIVANKLTIAARPVSIARPCIEKSGVTVGLPSLHYVVEPERALYLLFCQERGDAYSRYNSLLRRLVSSERALRRAVSQSVSNASG